MLRVLFFIFIAIVAQADNDTTIGSQNEKISINQNAQNLGANNIYIGDNNREITINQKIEIIDSSNETLEEIKLSLKELSQNKDKITNDFHKLLDNNGQNSTKLNSLYNEYKQLISSNNNIKEKVSHLEANIDLVIDSNNTEIKKLQKQMVAMQKDIAFLMDQFKSGNLKALSFYLLHIDAVYIDNTLYKGAGLGYERLYNSSLFQSISLISNISILTGTEENVIEDVDKQFYLFDIGLKKPFSTFDERYATYGRSSIGYLWGDEKSLYLKLGIGVEKYNRKNKIGLELDYFGILEKEEKTVTTYTFGNAEIKEEKKFQHGIALKLSISFTGF